MKVAKFYRGSRCLVVFGRPGGHFGALDTETLHVATGPTTGEADA